MQEAWNAVKLLREYKARMQKTGVIYSTLQWRFAAIRFELLECDWFIIGIKDRNDTLYCLTFVVDERITRSDDDKLVVRRRANARKDTSFQMMVHQAYGHLNTNVNHFHAWRHRHVEKRNRVYLVEYMLYHRQLFRDMSSAEDILRGQLHDMSIGGSDCSVPNWPKSVVQARLE